MTISPLLGGNARFPKAWRAKQEPHGRRYDQRIVHERVSNLLVHRDYSKRFRARIIIDIIEKDGIYDENRNNPNRYGSIEPNDFTSITKNSLLIWFFVNIGRNDHLGSGIRNL
jgi:predicted HTH transcriptional regulator